MNVQDLFKRLRIDGEPIGKVLQVQIDAEHTTVIYEHQKGDSDPVQRAITVESEAVSIA